MLKLLTIISLILLGFLSQELLAAKIISIELDEVVICPVHPENKKPPLFTEPKCYKTHAANINPQNTAIWVKTTLNIPKQMYQNKHPHSIFISGKTSSAVYFNGQFIGENGTPSLIADDEFPGKIDAMFYVQPQLIKLGINELVFLMSSHHGFLDLKSPVNFIGFGIYSDPSFFIQNNIWKSFIPFGALILGIIYFGVSCFSPFHRRTNILFLMMSIFAASQLFFELSRALLSYSYPFQDIRLLLIVSLSTCFGICLLLFSIFKILPKSSNNKNFWFGFSVVATIVVVTLIPGFDSKTAIAILIPSIASAAIIAIQAIKSKSKELWIYFSFFTILTTIIVFSLNQFHNLIFYYLITGVLSFLFILQALKLNKEQTRRREEQQQVNKLQFKLDQNEQKLQPEKIKINSSGKIELISTDKISYCRASGDYVEITLENNNQILFSGNLKELEKQLPATFSRVHRSYVVNMDSVISLKSTTSSQNKYSSNGVLLLGNGNEVPVSRRIMPKIRQALNS